MTFQFRDDTPLQKAADWFAAQPQGYRLIVGVLLDVLVGLLDHLTGDEVSFSVFYLIPITLVSRFSDKKDAILISTICAATWLVVDLSSGFARSHPLIPYWNASVRLAFFLITSLSVVSVTGLIASLREMTLTDALTGVANSRGFREQAQREIERMARYKSSLSMAYLDLDNFKSVNDTLGHSAGDDLLVTVSGILAKGVRRPDVVARLGGDEFVVLFPETDGAQATAVMSRINGDIAFTMRERGWPVTLSAGVVTFSTPPESVDETLRLADKLLYQAKARGKNTVVVARYSQGLMKE